jgi:hypothetical protein
MAETALTLPDREEMLARLLKINDLSHFRQYLYPRLLTSAGKQITAPSGVAMMLVLAMYDYVKECGLPSIATRALYLQAPVFVDALVSDVELINATKEFLREALRRN